MAHMFCCRGVLFAGAAAVSSEAAAKTKGFESTRRDLAALLAEGVQTRVAMNVSIVPAGAYVSQFARQVQDGHHRRQDAEAVSSWVQVAMLHEGSVSKREFELLALSLQDAIADALLLCRASVHVNDMHADNVDFVVADGSDRRPGGLSMFQRITNLIRRATSATPATDFGDISITQVKATYEVRIFEAMRLQGDEVARRIDRLQIYSKFAELSRLLARFVSQRSLTLEGVMLDDIGYASRQYKPQPAVTPRQLDSCVEEGLLADARRVHQYVVAFGGLIMLLITCAGSSIFALKVPSWVPSRMNPLVGTSPP